MNLFEILQRAGGGDAFARLARQYGLSEEQIGKAVEAFLPAFSAGLKRSTADPFGLAEFLRRLAAPDAARAYRQPDWLFGAGRGQGEDALGFLFGSPDIARSVAQQASAFTGLAQEKLNELMPALAALTMGGLAQQAVAANPILAALLRQTGQGEGEGPAAKGPLDRLEEEQAARERGGAAAADFARAQSEMMQAGLAAFQAGAAAWQQALGGVAAASGPGTQGPAGAKLSGGELFGEMFEPGRRLSEAYREQMEALVDQLRPPSRNG